MLGAIILIISTLISVIFFTIALFRREKCKIFFILFIVINISIVAQYLIYKHYHVKPDNSDKREKSIILNNNVVLSKIAKNNFNNLSIEPFGKVIFEQMSSNEYCNYSKYLVIYAYDGDADDVCNQLVSKFNNYIDYNYNKQPGCHSVSKKSIVAHGNINDQLNEIFYRFSLSFFQKEPNYPYFLPTRYAYEENIINYVKNNNLKFYYISLEYQGKYDKEKYLYQCNEQTGENCKCYSDVYTDAVFPDGKEKKDLFVNDSKIDL